MYKNTELACWMLASAIAGTTTAHAADAPAGSADSDTIQEITVTAQRREESLQKVPMAVIALTADSLERSGVKETIDLDKMVPGLKIGQVGNMTQFFINGVGQGVPNSSSNPAIAFNVDGIYIGRPTGMTGVMYDMSRIEVLKGPQGTLYGRNASAGAINVITNRPVFDDTIEAGLEVGNYSLVKTTGVANVKVSDTLALRFSGVSERHGGYSTDGYNDLDTQAGRAQVLWEPVSSLSMLAAIDYAHDGGKGDAPQPVPFVTSNPWQGPCTAPVNAYLAAHTPAAGALNPVRIQCDGRVDDENYGARGEMTWTQDSYAITALAAHRSTIQRDTIYPGSFQSIADAQAKQDSVEVRAASVGDTSLTWLVGLYYYHESIDATHITNRWYQGASELFYDPLTDRNLAIFTQETLKFTDRFRLTVGGRFTNESTQETGYNITTTGLTIPALGSQSWNKPNYKVGLDYDVTDRSMVYAYTSTGFKAGGFNQGLPPNTYNPEYLTAYVLGSKNRFFNDSLQVNVEGFYWNYRDKQFGAFAVINPPPATAIGNINVGKVVINGVSTDVAWLPWSGGQFTANLQYLQAANRNFQYNSLLPNANCPSTPEANGGFRVDCSGKPLSQSPKWSSTFGFHQTWSVPAGGQMVGGFTTHIESKSLASQTLDYVSNLEQPTYSMTDLDLSYTPPSKHFTFQVYCDNVGNKAAINGGASQPVPGLYFAYTQPPRTYGMRVDARY